MSEPTEKWINDSWIKKGLGAHTGVTVPPDALADLIAERNQYRSTLEKIQESAQAQIVDGEEEWEMSANWVEARCAATLAIYPQHVPDAALLEKSK